MMPTKLGLTLEGCICYIPGVNMYSVSAGITLILTVITSLSSADETESLRCYICVTDYEDSTRDPGCSISSTNVIVRACAVQHGYNRCISYRARNTKTGNTVFRRHCATREMCEFQCLFSHHTDCQKICCHGDLCNDATFEEYKGSTMIPEIQSTTKVPVITRNPNTTPSSTINPIVSSKSTSNPRITKKTTNAPVTTEQVIATEEDVVGGPPITSRLQCQDYRDQCAKYAAAPGYCQYWKDFMLIHCPRSCHYCDGTGTTKATTKSPIRPTTPMKSPTTTSVPDTTSQNVRTTKGNGGPLIGGPTTGCADTREECPNHAAYDGYCQYHYGFMLNYCPVSCNICGDRQLPESPTAGNMIITTKLKTTRQRQAATTALAPGEEDETDLTTTEQVIEEPTPFGPGGDYENNGCLDLRENCSYYAITYDDYCNYNSEFMAIYCPFSCGFCGITVPNQGAFPYPPDFNRHPRTTFYPDEEFPAPPSKKDARWLTSFCGECHNGYQECIPKCTLLLKDGIYEPTSQDVCMKLLGKPDKTIPC